MIYTDNTLRKKELQEIPGLWDFSDLAAEFTRDINSGFICKTEGNGMRDAGIHSGDYLLFTKDREPENGDIVYLEIYGQSMCRRIFFELPAGKTSGRIRIRREDGVTPDLVVDERDVQIQGIFEGLIRNKKRKKVCHFYSAGQAEQEEKKKKEKEKVKDICPLSDQAYRKDPSVRVIQMGLPSRLANRLNEIGIRTAGDLLDIPDKEALLAIPGIGARSYGYILEALGGLGFDARHLTW